MNPDIVHEILSDHKELASLPQVITEVIKISANSEASTKDIARVIKKDPNLTARILRVVNSPFYAPPNQITTINQAVQTLGTRAVIAMALTATVYNLVDKMEFTVDRKKFWRHSLEVALASQRIAEAVNYKNSEEAFIGGLLHDIGLLILENSFPDEFRRVWRLVEIGKDLTEVEEETWGTNHARVGQFLLHQWGLPEILSSAVGGHHITYGPEDTHTSQKLILIVNLANRISRFRIANSPPPEIKTIEERKLLAENLNLSNNDLARIEKKLISEVVHESGYLEIEVGSVEEILSEANQLLYEQYLIVENLLEQNANIRRSSDHEAQESVHRVIEIMGRYIEEAGGDMRKKALILKSAISTNEVIDNKGMAEKAASSVTNGTYTISLVLKELGKLSLPDGKISRKEFESAVKSLDRKLRDLAGTEVPEMA